MLAAPEFVRSLYPGGGRITRAIKLNPREPPLLDHFLPFYCSLDSGSGTPTTTSPVCALNLFLLILF
jgi:hypothetical protein